MEIRCLCFKRSINNTDVFGCSLDSEEGSSFNSFEVKEEGIWVSTLRFFDWGNNEYPLLDLKIEGGALEGAVGSGLVSQDLSVEEEEEDEDEDEVLGGDVNKAVDDDLPGAITRLVSIDDL